MIRLKFQQLGYIFSRNNYGNMGLEFFLINFRNFFPLKDIIVRSFELSKVFIFTKYTKSSSELIPFF